MSTPMLNSGATWRTSRAIALGGVLSCFPLSGCGDDSGDGESSAGEAPESDGGASDEQAADVGTDSGEDPIYEDVTGIRIIHPDGGALISGSAPVHMELLGGSAFEAVAFAIDDEEFRDLRFLRPVQVNSPQLDNGEHELRVQVRTLTGERYEDSLKVEVYNPEHRLLAQDLNQRVYSPGDEMVLDVTYNQDGLDVTGDFVEVDENSPTLGAVSVGDGVYRLTHVLGEVPGGVHHVRLKATNSAGESVENLIQLRVLSRPPLPVAVENAIYVEREVFPYAIGDPEDSLITAITGSNTVVGRARTPLRVEWEPEEEIKQLVIRAEGYSGYYVVPIEPGQGSADIEISLPAFKRGSDFDPVELALGLVSLATGVSFTEFEVKPFSAPSDGIQFVLRWDNEADLDLEVTAPDGSVIAFDSRTAGDGMLDLDANGLCERSPVSAEIISWPAGKEPGGNYEVRVNMYDACGVDAADYELIILSCGTARSIPGHIPAANADTSGVGEVIDTVSHNCVQHVEGTVTYEKKHLNRANDFVGAPFVPVRAVRVSDEEVLARGFTDKDGNYSLAFGNDGPSEYVIEVEATWADPILHEPRATVVPLTDDTPYRFRSDPIDGSLAALVFEDIEIPVDQDSGAFNIINIVRQGLEWVVDTRSVFIAQLGARWTPGAAPLEASQASFYFNDQLFMKGTADDPDEFDDPVIMHELMHFVVEKLSDDDHIGGRHNGTHTDPLLAWKEGAATGLGQIALDDSVYFDKGATSTLYLDVEDGTDEAGRVFGHILGTSDNTQKGDVSEDLIAMVIWDLYDPANEPGIDLMNSPTEALYKSMFEFVPAGLEFRGVIGTDFVDFLDGFRCMSGAGFASSVDPDLEILLKERDFRYDFETDGIGCDGF